VTKKERALKIIEALEKEYPDAECSLDSRSAFELIVATRLSAQCTDARVNIVTKGLFIDYNTPQALAAADIEEIERLIHSCGFYKTKARNIIDLSQKLIDEYDSIVPDTIEELIKLPGVGRKTANLIVGDIYGKPSIVVDTHCIRLTNRFGLVTSQDPAKIEIALRALIPPERSTMFCHRLVFHGRAVCNARKPNCAACCLHDYCKSADSFK
jgi:endonuclease-3